MVEMVDGSIIAQMGVTDMRHAIQYALTYPDRRDCARCRRSICRASASSSSTPPDMERFPCIGLAYDALGAGGTCPPRSTRRTRRRSRPSSTGEFHFGDIPRLIRAACAAHAPGPAAGLDAVLAADAWARRAHRPADQRPSAGGIFLSKAIWPA